MLVSKPHHWWGADLLFLGRTCWICWTVRAVLQRRRLWVGLQEGSNQNWWWADTATSHGSSSAAVPLEGWLETETLFSTLPFSAKHFKNTSNTLPKLQRRNHLFSTLKGFLKSQTLWGQKKIRFLVSAWSLCASWIQYCGYLGCWPAKQESSNGKCSFQSLRYSPKHHWMWYSPIYMNPQLTCKWEL